MTEYKNYKGIYLKADENIVNEAEISSLSLVILWASIPAAFLVFLIFTFLPGLITTVFSFVPRLLRTIFLITAKEVITNPSRSGEDIAESVADEIFGRIPDGIFWVLGILGFLLFAAWLGVCLVMTYRHFRCCLAITDFRVIGKANGKELTSPLNEIVNVYLEQSLWGKFMNYGNITVQTKKGSLTFRDIQDPKNFHCILMKYAENYCAH